MNPDVSTGCCFDCGWRPHNHDENPGCYQADWDGNVEPSFWTQNTRFDHVLTVEKPLQARRDVVENEGGSYRYMPLTMVSFGPDRFEKVVPHLYPRRVLSRPS